MDADEQARRELADRVKLAAIKGASAVANVSGEAMALVFGGDEQLGVRLVEQRLMEAATAASAVVLASDVRAPGECCCVRRDGQVMEVANPAERREHGVRVGSCRQGWRARLANIERLLSEADGEAWFSPDEGYEEITPVAKVREALAEVRAMLDNPAGGEG
jgi:hypothetical protein